MSLQPREEPHRGRQARAALGGREGTLKPVSEQHGKIGTTS